MTYQTRRSTYFSTKLIRLNFNFIFLFHYVIVFKSDILHFSLSSYFLVHVSHGSRWPVLIPLNALALRVLFDIGMIYVIYDFFSPPIDKSLLINYFRHYFGFMFILFKSLSSALIWPLFIQSDEVSFPFVNK